MIIRIPGTRKYSLGLAFTFLLILSGSYLSPAQPAQKKKEERKFEVTYAMFFPGLPKGTEELIIQLPYPSKNKIQKISIPAVTCTMGNDHEFYYDSKYDNKIFRMKFNENIPPMMELYVQYTVRRKPVFPGDTITENSDPKVFLKPDSLVPVNEDMTKLAAKITGNDKGNTARARKIYEHMTGKIKFLPGNAENSDGNAMTAMDNKEGDPVEYHALFTGMCRAANIPARMNFGFRLDDTLAVKKTQLSGFHCWAEFYDEKLGWVPVDFNEYFNHPDRKNKHFGRLNKNRVKLSTGRDIDIWGGPRQNYLTNPVILVDGKPYTNIKTHFSYKDYIKKKAQ